MVDIPLSSGERSKQQGELFAVLLRLHPIEVGAVAPSSGNQIQAAFLALVRQSDPVLSEWLHTPNQRRPYTLGSLQGFNHVSQKDIAEATVKYKLVRVEPGQVYWLRITMLDATVFQTFVQILLTKAHTLKLRIGEATFSIGRLLSAPEDQSGRLPWVAYSSFAALYEQSPVQKRYEFEFATPTAFSLGQRSWGKMLRILPEPAYVFDSLARQWESFAPEQYRLANEELNPHAIADWCDEYMIVSQYNLQTQYLPASKFGQTGFLGQVMYEVKGNPRAPEAVWLSRLARFALFSGVGYKTTMGMGQTRCISLLRQEMVRRVGGEKDESSSS